MYADIELINGEDLALLRRNAISKDGVKSICATAVVSMNSPMFCINETVQSKLHLPVVGKRNVVIEDSSIVECNVVSPLEVKFKNRRSTCRAIVLPGNSMPVLGNTVLLDMDVLIHPLRQELIVNPDHPYFAQMKLK